MIEPTKTVLELFELREKCRDGKNFSGIQEVDRRLEYLGWRVENKGGNLELKAVVNRPRPISTK